MTSFTMHAASVAAQEADESYLVGFADSRTQPQEYIILQRSIASDDDEPDTYFLEMNGQECSGYGGIRRATLDNNTLTLELADDNDYADGLASVTVTFEDAPADLKNYLTLIFLGTECPFTATDV
jgi:Immunity protein 10